ncbi:LuxR C-terminal-related transcriptional regulator [Vibrio parahaemolyticus]|uniref:LuxR C-terminal-related transcriptional regulator n=1 Tax=Vibrio parahaemolyticus TaxID=670 RepID=UPI001124AC76|nr:LuxR C-terminal-related transcriptional regulator [Vibrio parahaemolyticus]TOE34853.1 helix-turn-helix transcriptional regulator [Vibrio parahaemolyticus]
MEHQTTRNVILITEGSLQSSLLKDVLETKLGINVLLITPENLASPFVRNRPISAIVLDYSVITDEVFARYMEFKTPHLTGTLEILINCDKSISTDELFVWGALAGIFYTSDDIQTLQTGIDKVLQGDMWFSRKFAQQYITHLRRHSRPINKNVPAILTKREQQIITFLSMGASNQQIAEQLFVSENTVKTHLHNIFKKIDVKNRVQALIWAKENISVHSIEMV